MIKVVEIIIINKMHILPKNITKIIKKFEFIYILINKNT